MLKPKSKWKQQQQQQQEQEQQKQKQTLLAEVAARDVRTRWRKFDFSSCYGQLGRIQLAYRLGNHRSN